MTFSEFVAIVCVVSLSSPASLSAFSAEQQQAKENRYLYHMPPARKYNFPFSCKGCSFVIQNRQSLRYHLTRYTLCPDSAAFDIMSATEKKFKAEVSIALIPFAPKAGLSASNQTLLNEIKAFMDQQKEIAKMVRQDSTIFISNVISLCLDKYDVSSQLTPLKSFLSEKSMEFFTKNELSKAKIDELVSECALIYGQTAITSLIGQPPNYTVSFEKMLVNHIRQRNLDELERSAKLVDLILFSIKQSLLFKTYEDEMKEYKTIENLIDTYLKAKVREAGLLINQAGRFTTQDVGDAELLDDNFEANSSASTRDYDSRYDI